MDRGAQLEALSEGRPIGREWIHFMGYASHRRVCHGHVSHRRAPHGRASHGRALHGRVPYGRALHGRVPYGRAPHGMSLMGVYLTGVHLMSVYLSARIGIVQHFTLFWSLLYILACTAGSVLVLLSRIPHWKVRAIQLEPGRPNPEAVLVYQAGCALRCRGTVSIVASIVRILGSRLSSLMMSVLFSEPRSRARLKKSSAEFGVGIENGAAIENKRRERERERERLK